jgi:hypothetical protein
MNGRWRLELKLYSKLKITTPLISKTMWFPELMNSLKLQKACGIDGIPNECLGHLTRRQLVHLTFLINDCIRLSHFPACPKEHWRKEFA